MTHLDPRYSGENDSTGFSKLKPERKPDGYKRAKSETAEGFKSERELTDPFKRDVNYNRNLGIV